MNPPTGETTLLSHSPDDEFTGVTLSDTERERQLLAVAEEYTADINAADTAEEEEAVNKKWAEKLRTLGVRDTNNLHVWFNPGDDPYKAYDIETSARPAAAYLRLLQQDEPDLFTACVKASQDNQTEFASWLKHVQSGGSDEQDLELTLARWQLDLKMTAAIEHMLTYPGATEDILQELYR